MLLTLQINYLLIVYIIIVMEMESFKFEFVWYLLRLLIKEALRQQKIKPYHLLNV